MSAKQHNLHRLEIVAGGLKDLLDETVFVGGATIILYLPESLPDSQARPTDDVDCVVEISSRTEYAKLEKKLRTLGFKNVMDSGAPVCRWTYSGVTVDMMPTDPKILGFSNRWYKPGVEKAVKVSLPAGDEISIFTVPYFLASKVEAFLGRGKRDFYGSRDFGLRNR
jgi:predicted nucleotidyltransferase